MKKLREGYPYFLLQSKVDSRLLHIITNSTITKLTEEGSVTAGEGKEGYEKSKEKLACFL